MAEFRNATKLSLAGLIVLGLVAAALSAMAILQHRGGTAGPAAPPNAPGQTDSPELPDESTESADPPTPTPIPTPEVAEETTEPAGDPGSKVVVIGDIYSADEGSGVWVDEVAESLGWGEVINLSAEDRGYISTPATCDFEVCANFGGSIDLIVSEDPDIVITFGGTADGDAPLTNPATSYFQALREALPEADLVAISPVTTDSSVPYYLSMHNTTISEAVTAVDGVFIDVGQPGVGDGETLSEEAQASIASVVIEEMSGT